MKAYGVLVIVWMLGTGAFAGEVPSTVKAFRDAVPVEFTIGSQSARLVYEQALAPILNSILSGQEPDLGILDTASLPEGNLRQAGEGQRKALMEIKAHVIDHAKTWNQISDLHSRITRSLQMYATVETSSEDELINILTQAVPNVQAGPQAGSDSAGVTYPVFAVPDADDFVKQLQNIIVYMQDVKKLRKQLTELSEKDTQLKGHIDAINDALREELAVANGVKQTFVTVWTRPFPLSAVKLSLSSWLALLVAPAESPEVNMPTNSHGYRPTTVLEFIITSRQLSVAQAEADVLPVINLFTTQLKYRVIEAFETRHSEFQKALAELKDFQTRPKEAFAIRLLPDRRGVSQLKADIQAKESRLPELIDKLAKKVKDALRGPAE